MAFTRGFSREPDTHQSTQAARPPQAAAAGPAGSSTTSIIGSDLCIIGEQVTILTKGKLQVDGELRADLHCSEVAISRSGKVTGTVVGEKVSIEGEVNGVVRGLSVELKSTAKVDGEIHHQTLAIADGAHFDGRVRRPQETRELMPMLDRAQHETGGNV